MRHREVICFAAGLMRDPFHLINYGYDVYIEEQLKNMGIMGKNARSTLLDLQGLSLEKCSISKELFAELLQSLTTCEQLSRLDLSHNIIGEAEHYLASWPSLIRRVRSIPEDVIAEMVQSLQLTQLHTLNNTFSHPGLPQLKYLYLSNSNLQHLTITSHAGKLAKLRELNLCVCQFTPMLIPDYLNLYG